MRLINADILIKEIKYMFVTGQMTQRLMEMLVEMITKQPTVSDNDKWMPFKSEYDEYYKMETLQGKIPEEDEEILVTDGKIVWSDTFMREGMECYLDGGNDLVSDVIAWQPLPEPFKGVENAT